MRWFEYKTEVDALHAPQDLKDRLRAMKQSAAAPVQDSAAAPAAKPARRFPGWKKLAGMAACFAGGALTVLVAGGGLLLGSFSMGASASDNAATAAGTSPREPAAQSSTALYSTESARDVYGFLTEDTLNDTVEFKTHEEFIADEMDGNFDAESGSAQAVNDSQRTEEAPQTSEKEKTSRKIIYTAALTLETTEYDATLTALQEALNAAGGYVEHSENQNYGTSSRWVQYVLRVPVGQYRSFLTAAEGTGSLTDKTEDSQDITAQYVDVAARIETLMNQRTRLQQLSAQAETLTDLLEIEEKLSDVQYRLESYQRQLAVYDDQVDYCTVTVTVREVTVYTPVQPTALERMQNALTRGFDDFADTLFDGVLWLLRNLSWLLVLAVAVPIVRAVWKKRRTDRTK